MGAQDAHRGAKKKQRVACALTFLMRYHKEGDETWVSHITPESNSSPCTGSILAREKMKKFNQKFSTRKIMCTVFWDRQGVLLVEILPKGQQ